MAHAKKPSKASTVRKKALHHKDRRYQPPNRNTLMREALNSEFELGPSRLYTRKDENQLAAYFVLLLVAIAFILAFEFSGMADAFTNKAANIILWMKAL